MISGRTELIAHIGYPTESFQAPLIYNPYFAKHGIDVMVVPLGCKGEEFAAFFPLVFRLSNIRRALITMPHKIATVALLDEVMPAARVAGACNAVRCADDGRLVGDMFDGDGFVRGVLRKGRLIRGARALVVGSGGVGSAIAASLAKAEAAELALFDAVPARADGLAERLRREYPGLTIKTGSSDPTGYDMVVNATPLGMKDDDPLPVDVERIGPTAFVGEVVMTRETTPFLAAARARGCAIQVGTDMLFEQIPAYLEFFDLRVASPDELRASARLDG
jgi:shikimate dehydrogenase